MRQGQRNSVLACVYPRECYTRLRQLVSRSFAYWILMQVSAGTSLCLDQPATLSVSAMSAAAVTGTGGVRVTGTSTSWAGPGWCRAVP